MKYFDIERFKDFDRVYTFILCKREQRKGGMRKKKWKSDFLIRKGDIKNV